MTGSEGNGGTAGDPLGAGHGRSAPGGWPIDHVAIAVPDLGPSVAAWTLLGVPHAEDEDIDEQGVRVRVLRAGEGWIELLAPTREDSPVARFLATRGPGLHHVAFRVADVMREYERLLAQGAQGVSRRPGPGRAGSLTAFLHPRWSGGVLIELVQTAVGRPDGDAPSPT